MRLDLGKCYEFHLVDGSVRKLKLLGGSPLQWQMPSGAVVVGELGVVLGLPYTSWAPIAPDW